MEIGRVCLKIAGREAGKKCVVVDTDGPMLVVCGPGVRRRKCNLTHLEPMPQVFSISKGASDKEVYSLFGEDYKPKEVKAKPQVKAEPKKEAKKEVKKEAPVVKKEEAKKVEAKLKAKK
jgi:large subunit ribosomal protein L14e